jgi:carboxylesterase
MIWAYELALGTRLLGWSVLCIGCGLLLLLPGTSKLQQAFAVQALAWGAIDAVIALAGRRTAARRPRPAAAEAQHLRRLLWLNTALDFVYIAVGLYLALELGRENEEWRGHGWGVLVQGAFLLVFDALHALFIPGEMRLPGTKFFPGAEHQPSIVHAAQPVGAAVLVHGLPGTPAEMRSVAGALHRANWTVHNLLLPGFGPDIPTIIDRRWSDWVAAVSSAQAELQRKHTKVLLVGYSFGGAVAVAAASHCPPAGLLLLAPFILQPPLWQRIVITLLSPLLPHSFRPYARANFADARVRSSLQLFFGDANLDDPGVQQVLRELEVPGTLMQEVAQSRSAFRLAPTVRTQALVLQGAHDVVSQPAHSQTLARLLGPQSRYLSVDAGHELLDDALPAWPVVESAILDFAQRVALARAA